MPQRLNDIDVKRLVFYSRKGKEVDVSRGLVLLQYYESILENSVKATVTFADTGFRDNGDGGVHEESDIDIQGGEKVFLELKDEKGNKVKFTTDDYQLRILSVPNTVEHTQHMVITVNLCTKEYLQNELEEYYITKRYDGNISDSVEKILKEVLKTPKKLDIEPTQNKFNFLGHVEKVFAKLVWLSKRSVPDLPKIRGNSAGYFFYETSEGFKFKSIDGLLSTKPKRKLIFNNTIYLPEGYDAKILNQPVFTPTIDVLKKLRMGTYDNKLVTFDLYNNKYEEKEINGTGVLAGKALPELLPDIKKTSRRSTAARDVGVLPPGETLKTQLQKAKETNFDIENILNQSFMRYNQLFSIRTSITIYADLTLHAGDVVFCDFPELSSRANKIISNKKSGNYLIVDLCHYISPNGPNYTKLNLVRDSFGRKAG
jgi:hypothetical protein